MYVKKDMRDIETTLFEYYDLGEKFRIAKSGELDHGGQPCVNSWGYA